MNIFGKDSIGMVTLYEKQQQERKSQISIGLLSQYLVICW